MLLEIPSEPSTSVSRYSILSKPGDNNLLQFCHNLYAQSVKAMRFPPKSYHDPLSPEERRQREQEDLEFAQEMAEDDDMY